MIDDENGDDKDDELACMKWKQTKFQEAYSDRRQAFDSQMRQIEQTDVSLSNRSKMVIRTQWAMANKK